MIPLLLGLVTAAHACDGKPCNAAGCSMPAQSETAAVPAGATVARLKVTGMKCGACVEKVKAALQGMAGVTVSSIDVETGIAEVGYDGNTVKVEALVSAVNATGHFTATAM
jgi:copper chaperone CopZ